MGGPAAGGRSNGGKHQVEMTDSPDGQGRGDVQVGSEAAAESVSERAALESVSPTLLMPGEDPSSPYIPDAEHWITVYSELYNFTVGILNRFRTEMAGLQKPAQDYLRSHDVIVHEEQIQRFAQRLAFWNRRLTRLQARSGKSQTPADRQVATERRGT